MLSYCALHAALSHCCKAPPTPSAESALDPVMTSTVLRLLGQIMLRNISEVLLRLTGWQVLIGNGSAIVHRWILEQVCERSERTALRVPEHLYFGIVCGWVSSNGGCVCDGRPL